MTLSEIPVILPTLQVEQNKNILLLDSDEQSAQDIQRFLKVSAYAFTISHASDLTEGLNYLKGRKTDLILLDGDFTDKKDFSALRSFTEREKIPVILLSDYSVAEAQKQAKKTGATDFIVKNKINLFHLQKSIASALRLSEAETRLDNTVNDLVTLHESFYSILGKLEEGVLVLNAQNALRYANTKAYSLLGQESLRNHLTDYLRFREVETEENIELSAEGREKIQIRINELKWNGERANLFIVSKSKEETAGETAFLENDAFKTLINSISEKMLLLKDDEVVFANRAAARALKSKVNALLGKKLNDLFESKQPFMQGLSLQSFLAPKESEGFICGMETPVEITWVTTPLNLNDQFFHLLTFTEKQVPDTHYAPAARSDEENFSSENVLHLASHDLREPVRTVLNYVQLISDKLDAGKYADAGEYAGFARQAASRMEKLLTDLKTYIGLNTHHFTLGKVSMKITAADALKKLKARIEETGAEISVAELPDISADRELVELLLVLLVDNGLKFSKKGKKPVIDIGFDKYEGKVVFCVRDNGIGISKKYQQKIFELFERLNRVDEYPGNGLGLAIAKKIVETHGGNIWVESLPGFGSSFYFTLQAK